MFDKLNLTQFIQYQTFNKICELDINKNGQLRDIVLNLILTNPEKKVKIER
jgi:hypothetical protein